MVHIIIKRALTLPFYLSKYAYMPNVVLNSFAFQPAHTVSRQFELQTFLSEMYRQSMRERQLRVPDNVKEFTSTQKPRFTKRASASDDQTAAPAKQRVRTDKSACPDVVPDVTLLCNAKKLGQILNNTKCTKSNCRGTRHIEDCDCETHGGCGVFEMRCSQCDEVTYFETGTYYQAEENDYRTGRYEEATLLEIGNMFGGGGVMDYQELGNALGMSVFSERTQHRYFWRYYHAAEQLWKEVQDICHQRLKDEGRWDKIIGLFDGGWLHRGYASPHGSGAIVDVQTGMILWLGHKSTDESKFGNKKHIMSSGMMEVVICEEQIEAALAAGAKFLMIVADADAGIQGLINKMNIKLGRCCNHGGKNIGNKGMEIGKDHAGCCCPIKKRVSDGEDYVTGEKEHVRVSDDIAKRAQISFGAVTSICGSDKEKWKAKVPQIIEHYFDCKHNGVSTGTNHLKYRLTEMDDDEEDEGWVALDITAQCDHDLFIKTKDSRAWVSQEFNHKTHKVGGNSKDATYTITDDRMTKLGKTEQRKHCPYMPRAFARTFDCPDQRKKWLAYLDEKIMCDADMFCTPEGAVRTNQVETIWKHALKFRTKDCNIRGDKYRMLGWLAAAHFNRLYIMQWRPSYCAQARFAELLGLRVPESSRQKWQAANEAAVRQSVARHKEEYKQKRGTQRQASRERKAAHRVKAAAALASYKSGGFTFSSSVGGSSGNKRKGKGPKLCKKCGQVEQHSKGMRSCIKCKEREAAEKQKGKGKRKCKRKRKRSDDDGSSEEEEEEEYDESQDEELNTPVDERIKSMKVGSRIEMVVPTTFGDSWEWGVITGYDGRYIVDWVDDDNEIYEKKDLRVEKWKYIK